MVCGRVGGWVSVGVVGVGGRVSPRVWVGVRRLVWCGGQTGSRPRPRTHTTWAVVWREGKGTVGWVGG